MPEMLECIREKFPAFFPAQTPPTINLALQGGGAHGAFTWGVLDALLEDGRLSFEGVSGTSAGAMNAIVLAHGLMQGGRDGAREALQKFWHAVAMDWKQLQLPFKTTLQLPEEGIGSSLKVMLEWTKYFSPEQLNPWNVDPLRDILTKQIDFGRLRHHSPVKLFIAATNANTGKLRLFTNKELNIKALLASACLPSIHRTIEINGIPYWDGGYSANPAVFPLFSRCKARDILLVLLSPLLYEKTPVSVDEIRARVLDISFNSAFLSEMALFARAREDIGRFSPLLKGAFERKLERTHFHLIQAEDLMSTLASETRLKTDLKFLEMLKEQGRLQMQAWLSSNFSSIGKRSSVELSQLF